MRTTTPTYLISRLFYRIFEFIKHWYVHSAKLYWHFVINQMEKIDYYLAMKITFKNLFSPLYKDYSVLGYILGFIFRSGRLLVAVIVYLILFGLAAFLYLLWLAVPPAIVYGIITGRSIQ